MLNIEASPGDQITLDAGKSKDPDDDDLFFSWWHYNEADSYNGKTIPKSDLARTTITIPLDAKYGDTIHIICEVSDSGEPPLSSYKRIIIRIKK
ncbi:hypothetical protein SAMN04487907_10719 [Zunongwangia mangrovi]|uniref:Cellulose-binding Sde182 C-terminal domain-containing protein n=1 Tax=Zunongwangia mangrovi TaxID=1334022 RepID=A0A1I1L2D1_9FLAO|nr:hypothetical protein [Zunongwangia mangrovi]SFC67227.1 hypothetical protein SAMN04487907_10719 [Zunongwangia mangrovi]